MLIDNPIGYGIFLEKAKNGEDVSTFLEINSIESGNRDLIKTDDKLYKSDIVLGTIVEMIDKTETEIMKKWDFEYNSIGVSNYDNDYLKQDFMDILDAYFDTDTMEDFVNSDVIENLEDKIQEAIYTEIDKWKENNQNLSNKTLKEIKKDAKEILNKNYQKMADTLYTNKTRDKLEKLCNQWEKAYKKLDIEKMNSLRNKIEDIAENKIFKDNELSDNAKKIIIKNDFVMKKIENGEDGKLSDAEEEIFDLVVGKGK